MIDTQFDVHEVTRIYDLQHTPSNLQGLKNTSRAQRLERIRSIERYLLDSSNQQRLFEAMWHDLHKSKEEVIYSEIVTTLTAIRHIYKNLAYWMNDRPVGAPLALLGIQSSILYEPKGHVLIMSPWNYPVQLVLIPLVHAIAAGNAVLIKPSELCTANSQFMQEMIDQLFPKNEVAVIQGDIPVSTALLNKKFNHIFFTGSPKVGKIVMEAAAKHLTSVTLELGGKSPVVIDQSAPIDSVAKKIAWGKFINSGQTCIAPDYLIIHQEKKQAFIAAFQKAIQDLYGSDISSNQAYCRIINEKNVLRIQSLLEDAVQQGAEVLCGGQVDANDKYIAPTLLDKVSFEMDIMQEEIFGPVLPILTFETLEELIDRINHLPKPLALYIMSKRKRNIDFILKHTSSGGVVINDLMTTTANPNLPFGGINHSGIGKSNGHHGFIEFSNERGVMRRRFLDFRMLFPPYKNSQIFKWLIRISRL